MPNTFSLNQFVPVAIKGSDASGYNQNNRDGLIDPSSTSAIYGGTALKLTGNSGTISMYDKAAVGDVIVGFARYTKTPSNQLNPNDAVSVAYSGSFIYMESGGAIAVGDLLDIVATGDKVVTHSTGTVIGRAEMAASATGQLIVVNIQAQ